MPDRLAAAILQTIHYADLFDYPLTSDELFHFLIGVRATRAEIFDALNDHSRLNGNLARFDGYVMLPRRAHLIAQRARLHADAATQLPRARFYARCIAHFPFVRLIALTGALAMQNARDRDIDLFVVTAPGRLWLVRALIIALVRIARVRGDKLCPNFLVTENALAMSEQNLYTAHEIAQMIPLYGFETYAELRRVNPWTKNFLPNAFRRAPNFSESRLRARWIKKFAERWLGGKLGDAIERWERARKIARLAAQTPRDADNALFTADICRGFFSGHGRRVLKEFETRIMNDKLQMTKYQ